MMDAKEMCQGHKCYKMLPRELLKSPCSINIGLCPECYQDLIDEILEDCEKGNLKLE